MEVDETCAAEGLALLDIGIAIFDKCSRLVYANPAFRALRRYPDDVCHDAVTLEALLRFNAERGDFGEGDVDVQVAERLKEIDQAEQREIEREMADGQILRIRYRRTGSGGLVVTFEDRTEERRARDSLAASEERHMLVTRATSDGIYDWDVTQDQLYVSERLSRILDIELGAKASGHWAERVHPDDYQGYRAAIRAHFKGSTEALDYEYRVRARDGGYRWIHDRGVGVRNANGRVVRLVGAVRDITEIKEAKAELDRTEARLVASLATISDGILLVDADDRVQLWNERYYEIFSEAAGGADLTAIITKGRPFFDMIRDGYRVGMFKPHPEGVDAWVAARKQAWDQPVSQWELELANGRWILLNERQMPDGGRVSVYTDVTALKEREAQAQAARERFEEAIEAISSGFALWDAEDRLVVCNSRYRRYFADLADMVTPGRPFREVMMAAIERGMFPGQENNAKAFLAATAEQRARASGEPREQHLGDGLWLQITDHHTAEGGIVSIYTDVTELKNREAEITQARDAAEAALDDLRKAQARLVQAEKMASLGQLTAGIAHEIKNPLNFVNNFAKLSDEMVGELAEILEASLATLESEEREEVDELIQTVRENLVKITEHGKRADSIVKNMLMHAREGPSERQTVGLNAIAEEALNLAYHGARAEHPGFNIEMVKDLSPEVGEVECYPQDLMRVFLNLISNGMYAADKRRAEAGAGFSPTISLATRANGNQVEIEIRDNGIGIPRHLRERIFLPFFTTKPAGEGTGLGLSLSYDIVVKQHGGDLSVESEPGEFSAFHVSLPTRVSEGEGGDR